MSRMLAVDVEVPVTVMVLLPITSKNMVETLAENVTTEVMVRRRPCKDAE